MFRKLRDSSKKWSNHDSQSKFNFKNPCTKIRQAVINMLWINVMLIRNNPVPTMLNKASWEHSENSTTSCILLIVGSTLTIVLFSWITFPSTVCAALTVQTYRLRHTDMYWICYYMFIWPSYSCEVGISVALTSDFMVFLCHISIVSPVGPKVCGWYTQMSYSVVSLWRPLSHVMVFVLISWGITITYLQALNAVLRLSCSIVSFQWPYRTLWHFLMSCNSLSPARGGGLLGWFKWSQHGQSDILKQQHRDIMAIT